MVNSHFGYSSANLDWLRRVGWAKIAELRLSTLGQGQILIETYMHAGAKYVLHTPPNLVVALLPTTSKLRKDDSVFVGDLNTRYALKMTKT
jgi:hypothetical protein